MGSDTLVVKVGGITPSAVSRAYKSIVVKVALLGVFKEMARAREEMLAPHKEMEHQREHLKMLTSTDLWLKP
jgi:hypothetical protein